MSLTRGRWIAALITALALVLAATSWAVNPKPGRYSTSTQKDSVTFTVDQDKILNFFAASIECHGGQPAIVEKKIKIKPSGKFSYDGKASSPLGDKFHLDVEAEFVSKKKAKGEAQREGCDPQSFTAKLRND